MKQTTKRQVSVWSLIKDAIRYYPKSFAANFVFILLATLTYTTYQISNRFALGIGLSWVFLTIAVLLSIYFWVTAIVATDHVLSTNSSSLPHCFRIGLKKYSRVLCFFVIYLGTYVTMTCWLQLLMYWGTHYPALGHYQGIINLCFAGLPLLLLLLLFLLALPLIVSEQLTVIQAFKRSIQLAWRSRLAAVFMMFILIMVLIYLVMPNTHHARWLQLRNLDAVFDFFCLVIVGPFLINYLLLLVRRLQQA